MMEGDSYLKIVKLNIDENNQNNVKVSSESISLTNLANIRMAAVYPYLS